MQLQEVEKEGGSGDPVVTLRDSCACDLSDTQEASCNLCALQLKCNFAARVNVSGRRDESQFVHRI